MEFQVEPIDKLYHQLFIINFLHISAESGSNRISSYI